MANEKYDILVFAQNPEGFLSWNNAQKLKFYEATLKWHDYIADLRDKGEVTHAWGAQRLPGRVRPISTKTLLIAIYRATFDRFSELIAKDPLWDLAWYEAPILKPIEDDYEDDLARYNKRKALIEERLGKKIPMSIVTFQGDRPEIKAGGDLEVLTFMRNEPHFGLLSDEQRLEADEHVLQMHDYHRPLREMGIVPESWGTYQNCGFGVWAGGNRAAGVYLWKVNNYDEFDILFQTDPVRPDSRVRTVVLTPFDESRRRSEEQLKDARRRLGNPLFEFLRVGPFRR